MVAVEILVTLSKLCQVAAHQSRRSLNQNARLSVDANDIYVGADTDISLQVAEIVNPRNGALNEYTRRFCQSPVRY